MKEALHCVAATRSIACDFSGVDDLRHVVRVGTIEDAPTMHCQSIVTQSWQATGQIRRARRNQKMSLFASYGLLIRESVYVASSPAITHDACQIRFGCALV